MSVQQAVTAWYTAPDSEEQAAALDRLVQMGKSRELKHAQRVQAVSALIELLHLAGSPVDRVARVRALGRAGEHWMSIPALHAETHSPHADVRTEAFVALGRLGLPFGGTLVARWLDGCELDDEPAEVLEAAFFALARTGHPRVGEHAMRLWSTGRIRATCLHTALAEAVSPVGLDLAVEHVADADVAIPAAMHLSALFVDDLDEALRPMRRSGDLTQMQLADRLGALQRPDLEDHLLDVLGKRGRSARLGRHARQLRIHQPAALLTAFEAMVDGADPRDRDVQNWVRVALLAGIPELQPAALRLAEAGGVDSLYQAISLVSHPSEGLEDDLARWATHADDVLACTAVRTRVNVYGTSALPAVDRLAQSERACLRSEAVRAYQNLLRDDRDSEGRTRLPHKRRQTVEKSLRSAIRSTDPGQVERGCFAAGNIGLTGLRSDLMGRLSAEQPMRVRRAAATALSELPSSKDVEPLALCLLNEAEAPVRFRLIRVLERCFEGGASPGDVARQAACSAANDPDLQVAVVGTLLLGHAHVPGSVAPLKRLADGSGQAKASAAIAALGLLGDEAGVPVLDRLLSHSDPVRRRRAAQALGRLGSAMGAPVLVKVVESEQDADVRRAAVESLLLLNAASEVLRTLRPRGADDPLLFELLQLRNTSARGAGSSAVADLDAQLTEAVPGFKAGRMFKRSPEALKSLRTALWLSGLDELPAGLDAAPPVLFWVKGLEIWLDDAAAPLRSHLLGPRRREALAEAQGIWSGLQSRLPTAWEEPSGGNSWKHLLKNLLDARRGAVMGLRPNAAALLSGGPLSASLGVTRWVNGMSDGDRTRLANTLVKLADLRNPLTHRRAGTTEESSQVRDLALEAAGLVARLG